MFFEICSCLRNQIENKSDCEGAPPHSDHGQKTVAQKHAAGQKQNSERKEGCHEGQEFQCGKTTGDRCDKCVGQDVDRFGCQELETFLAFAFNPSNGPTKPIEGFVEPWSRERAFAQPIGHPDVVATEGALSDDQDHDDGADGGDAWNDGKWREQDQSGRDQESGEGVFAHSVEQFANVDGVFCGAHLQQNGGEGPSAHE